MKKIILLLIFFSLSSCTADYISKSDDLESEVPGLYYFKDRRTGLCFATSGDGIACVPCDSLKKIKFE